MTRNQQVDQLIIQISSFGPKLAIGLILFAAFWLAGFILGNIVIRAAQKARLDQELAHLLRQTTVLSALTLGSVTALGTMGVDISALVAGLGLTGFALGFAFKEVLSNMLAGVLILMYRPFRHSDHITVAGFEGTVIDIDLRYTTLQGEDKKILIPNSILLTNAITVLKKYQAG